MPGLRIAAASPFEAFTNSSARAKRSPTMMEISETLYQLEREAKAQAESEYEGEHGSLPEQQVRDPISVHSAAQVHKKRKVRAAMVSRRKSIIYMEKLEDELRIREKVNTDLETRIGVFREVMRVTKSHADALQRSVNDGKLVQTGDHETTSRNPPLKEHSSNENLNFLFRPGSDDAGLRISPEEIFPSPRHNAQKHKALPRSSFAAECSDGGMSPVSPKHHRFDEVGYEFLLKPFAERGVMKEHADHSEISFLSSQNSLSLS